MCGSDWPVLLLNGDYDRVWDATSRVVEAIAGRDASGLLGCCTGLWLRGRLGNVATRRGRMAAPLTDQAIVKIKELIISGEFTPGSKLPREQDLAKQLGLSRNSLREAVRALTLVGVLDARVGDGTYVTSLDSELLLTGMGFVGDLLAGPTLLEVHQVRRILEPVATGLAATRLAEEDFAALERCLAQSRPRSSATETSTSHCAPETPSVRARPTHSISPRARSGSDASSAQETPSR
jgi:hypothetical protein